MARIPITVLALSLCLGAAAHAFMAGDPKAGQSLAVDHCVACHTLPDAPAASTDSGAPGFVTIAGDDTLYTLNTMRAAMKAQHWPDASVTLSSKDADNVIAFIVSLRKD